MHTTRSEMPKSWPMNKKGTKYISVSRHAKNASIPILKIVKDILKIARTKKEVKQILKNKDISVNNKLIGDEKFPVQIDDIVSFDKIGKKYRAGIRNKKFYVEEVKGKDSDIKVVKVIGKRILLGGKIQLNLLDGQNILGEGKASVGDSIVVNLKTKKIEKILPLKEKCIVEILSGKYAGQRGNFMRLEERKRKKVYSIKLDPEKSNFSVSKEFKNSSRALAKNSLDKKEIGLSLDLIKVTE